MLDEPTNHLDVDSREALIMAINDYEGAVILISHDRHIIETCADELWLVHDGTVKPFDGDMEDYTRLVLDKSRAGPAQRARKPSAPEPRTHRAGRQPRHPRRRPTSSTGRWMNSAARSTSSTRRCPIPTLFAKEPKKAADFTRLRAKLAADLEDLENQWLEAQVG